MLRVDVSKINEVFSLINNEEELYLPIELKGETQFGKWTPEADVQFERLSMAKSAKDFFFTNNEQIATFKSRGKEIQVEGVDSAIEPFVVFGVRGCDVKGLSILDRLFLKEPVDTFYKRRRDMGIIITLSCTRPEETCFCSVFGIEPMSPGGDIETWILDDMLYWKALTQKGEALTKKVGKIFEAADDTAILEWKAEGKKLFDKLPFKELSLAEFVPKALMEKFNLSEWIELFPACLSCGTCTFICPTCHCYDIQDFDTGDEIQRSRCWDSCMYSDFTQMAHGNPRPGQLERFRQRYMHKLIYFPDQNDGVYACVGCGRCIQKCPISMNIVKVIKALGGEDYVQ